MNKFSKQKIYHCRNPVFRSDEQAMIKENKSSKEESRFISIQRFQEENMNGKLLFRTMGLFIVLLLLLGTGAFHAQAQMASTVSAQNINIPGAQITALAVYKTGNKIFAADDNSQSIKVIAGANNQIVATIPNVGGGVFDMAVNEQYGKIYAASDKACCTTGITPGNGLISVINASTNQIITQINPGTQGNVSYFLLGSDQVHNKIYVSYFSGVGVIDAATNAYTPVPGLSAPYPYLTKMGINTVTNEIFLANLNSGLTVINGNNLSVQTLAYPTGARQALDVAVNEVENRVYVTMITIPGQSQMGIYILDRDTGSQWFVGADDLEPLAFNNVTNQLFTGVQVGSQASVVDGATNQLTYVNLGTSGIGDVAVREATNRAYMANIQYTVIVSGASKGVYDTVATNLPPRGGLVLNSVQVNQTTGKVYVVNDDQAGIITVLQDPPPERDTTGVFRPSNGLLYLKNSNDTGFADVAINYGLSGDYPVVGDWDGNGTTTIGIYRGNTFYLRNENTIGFATIVFAFGQVGDQPVAGDWDGDGVDTIGVYRSNTFYLRNNNSAGPVETSFILGNPGDVGIAGDWNGDGMDTTGVFRPSSGYIFLKNFNTSGIADMALNYGLPGDKPVTGDWNNDGVDTIGVYRGNTFYLRNFNTNGFADIVFSLGNAGDMPIAGNWDGIP